MTVSRQNSSTPPSVSAMVLAAGSGTRMKSALPKPLHLVAGLPMVEHVLRAVAALEPETTTIIASPAIEPSLAGVAESAVRVVIQDPPLGTGHAVMTGLDQNVMADLVLVVYADHPLVTSAELLTLVETARTTRSKVCLLTCLLPDAAAYGRIVRDHHGSVKAIVEAVDDDPSERTGVIEINSGIMVFDRVWGESVLRSLPPHPAKGEYFLTDLVAAAAADGPGSVSTVTGQLETLLGVNDRAELARVDTIMRGRIRREHLLAGVTMIGAESIIIDIDVAIGVDTVLLPNCVINRGVAIGDRCRIGPGTMLESCILGHDVEAEQSVIRDSQIGDRSHVGPYAHIRAGSVIASDVFIGNFGEIKNSRLDSESRSGHFSYLGDAAIGRNVNIGAGTVTCNFDGVDKNQTTIGDNAFIGSDSMLIAPLTVGEGGRTGAGSVVTKDVAEGATVVGIPARPIRRKSTRVEAEG